MKTWHREKQMKIGRIYIKYTKYGRQTYTGWGTYGGKNIWMKTFYECKHIGMKDNHECKHTWMKRNEAVKVRNPHYGFPPNFIFFLFLLFSHIFIFFRFAIASFSHFSLASTFTPSFWFALFHFLLCLPFLSLSISFAHSLSLSVFFTPNLFLFLFHFVSFSLSFSPFHLSNSNSNNNEEQKNMLATCNLQCIHLKVRIPNTTPILFLLNFLPILSLFHISINLSHICLPY